MIGTFVGNAKGEIKLSIKSNVGSIFKSCQVSIVCLRNEKNASWVSRHAETLVYLGLDLLDLSLKFVVVLLNA